MQTLSTQAVLVQRRMILHWSALQLARAPLEPGVSLAPAWPAGPVDGPVLFNNCSSSQVAVACQQFQAKGCKDIDFGEHPCSSMAHAST